MPLGSPSTRRQEPVALADGTVLADRYRIVRHIGRGGMGEVYEAEDRRLSERVALKIVRADVAASAEGAVERFTREIQLARRVTHPNVCRIFELGTHAADKGEMLFLTMELLQGESLDERLRRTGPMPTDEARIVVGQMAAGLGAAHEAGIIHRDFKSANVMLVPDRRGATRAVVMDFGLARSDDARHAGLTGTAILGSPAYMAPEQVECGALTPATDVYALGVVMFEMVTGRLPFEGETPLAAAVKRLTEPPPAPRSVVPTIDPTWDAVILRCLEQNPERRFRKTDEVIVALDAPSSESVLGPAPGPAPPPAPRPVLSPSPTPTPAAAPSPALEPPSPGASRVPAVATRHSGAIVRAGTAVALAAAALVTWWGLGHAPSSAPPPASPQVTPAAPPLGGDAIAVLPLRNASGRPDESWIGTAMQEAITAHLEASGDIPMIDGDRATEALRDLGLAEAETYAGASLARLRKNLGCTTVVAGSFDRDPSSDEVRVLLRLHVGAATEPATLTAEGTAADLPSLASQLGRDLRSPLGLKEAPGSADAWTRAVLPSTPEAARAHADGLARQRRGDVKGGLAGIVRATSLQPGFAWGHFLAARTFVENGQTDKARSSFDAAHANSAELPEELRRFIEACWRGSRGDVDGALEVFADLHRRRPCLIYGVELASVQARAGKLTEVRRTLDGLRKLPPPFGNDPRVGIFDAWSSLDMEQRRAAVASALADARARELRAAQATLLATSAWTEWTQGRIDQALGAAEEARRIHASLGATDLVAEDMEILAAIRWQQGKNAVSASLMKEAQGVFEDLGIEKDMGITYFNLGVVLFCIGELDLALKEFEKAGSLGHEEGTHLGISMVHLRRGELADAEKRLLASLRAQDSEPLVRGFATFHAGDVKAAQGDLDGARARHEEAVGLLKTGGFHAIAFWPQMALATLHLEQGRTGQAEAGLLAAAEETHALQAFALEARARTLLATVARGRGDGPGARKALSSVPHQEHDDIEITTRTLVETLAVMKAFGTPQEIAEARRAVETAWVRMRDLGLVLLAIDVEIALAETDPDPVKGRERLARVLRRAEGIGYLRPRARRAAGAAAAP